MRTEFYDQDENFNSHRGKPQYDKQDLLLRKRRNKRNSVICAIFGITFLFSGITLLISFHAILEHFVKKCLVLTPNSYILDYWKEPPIPIYTKIYFFNITNKEDYPWHTVKPRLQEVGPYTYREYIVKVDLKWHENHTVSYRQIKTYQFEPDLSVGSQDDYIFTVNSPHVAASDLTKTNAALKFAMQTALELLSSFVIRRRVHQLLFDGFNDLFMKSAHILGLSPYSKFGYLIGKNGTDDGYYTVHTGVGDGDKLAAIDQWRGKHSFTQWTEQSRKLVHGTDGSWFPPFLLKSSRLHVFSSELCRSFQLEYSGPSEVFQLAVYRYKLANNTFSNCDGLLERRCSGEDIICRTLGVYNMSHCAFGVPIFASFPHFYKADFWLVDNFDGLHPNRRDHETYIDIDPVSGVPANVSFKVQLNLLVNKSYSESLKEMLFPLLWMEKAAHIDEHFAGMLLVLSKKSYLYSKIASFILIVIGVIFIVVTIYRIYKRDTIWKKINHFPLMLMNTN